MKVLHVAQPTVAGVPVVVRQLVIDQLAHDIDAAVASPLDGDLPTWLGEAGARHLTWQATRAPGPGTLGETRSLGAVISEFAPDLVHLHSAKAGLAGRLAIRGRTPTVFQPHAWSFEAVGGMQGRGAQVWERSAGRWTDLLICVSEEERAVGQRAGVSAPTLVLPNGVDVRRLLPADAAARQRTRAALGLPDGRLMVCVGRLARQKGQDLLLAALPGIVQKVPDAVVAFVGDGPDAEVLRTVPAPSALFVGNRTDVADWLVAADLVVLPSRWEAGLSLVAMEAMAVARSVVTTDVAGARALDRAGAVVPVDDVDALTDAIVRRLLDPALATREGVRGRARVELEFDEANTAPRVRAAYRRVIEQRSGAGAHGAVGRDAGH